MNYKDFYSLKDEPFNNVPDLKFYYPGNQYSRIYSRLLRVARDRKGLGILTGNVGSGKTTLSRQLLHLLRGDSTLQPGLLVLMHSEFHSGWFVRRIAGLIGIKEIPENKTEALAIVTKKLLQYDKENIHTVILIDEANKMVDKNQLEEIRGFLNLEKGDRRLISFILFGTNDLLTQIQQNESLNQRVFMKLMLKPMDFELFVKYIKHRINIVGGSLEIFPNSSLSLIYEYTKGNPRITNALCDNLLFEGALSNSRIITKNLIIEVCDMLGFKI